MVHRTRYKIITPCLSRLYTRIYPRSSPFPALKFHLQTQILIHRMRGSALGGLSLVWGIRAETNDSIAPHVRYLTEELLFSFHTHYKHYLAVLPPIWHNHNQHNTRQDFILMHILYTRHDAVNTLYPNPNISAQQSSLSFFFALYTWDS